MSVYFELITSTTGVMAICSAILLWAGFAYIFFSAHIRKVQRGVRRAVADISTLEGEAGFAAGFNDFEERIAANPILRHAWSEFDETLIKNPELQPLGIRNTRGAGEFFHRGSIAGQHVNLRFHGAMPNLLTGMGILGTFLGLVAGISLASGGLGSSDTDVVKQALQQLLHGASLAFLTSITGLVSSMLYSWREKHAVHKLDALIRKWNDTLDARLIRVTGEYLASCQLSESQQQTAVLTQFTTDLAFQIADAFQERISSSLGPALDALLAEVKQMREDQGQRNDDALQEMVKRFSESLSGSAGQELNSLGDTLGKLNDRLEQQVSALGERQEQLNAASSRSVEEMHRELRRNLEQMQEGVKAVLTEMTQSVGVLVREMTTVMENAVAVGGEFKGILERTGEVTGGLNEAAGTVAAAAEPVTQAVAEIRETSREIRSTAESNRQVAAQISQSVNSIATLQAELKDSWARYEDRFDAVDRSMANAMNELVSGLEAYSQRVNDYIRSIDNHAASIVSDLAAANGELSTAVEELNDSLRRMPA